MNKFIVILIICCLGENGLSFMVTDKWVSKAKIMHPLAYFSEVMQEFVYELERREWCNLKMVDVHKNINTVVANWNVTGTVTYTNGFVISTQVVDLHYVEGGIVSKTIDNLVYPTASVTGVMMFHDINIGYDVIANLDGIGEQRYTGEMLNTHISFKFFLNKDLVTEKISVKATLESIRGPHIRMIYSPANHITEVLSRHFQSSDNWDGAVSWIPTFESIITDIVTQKINFPKICFNDC